MVRALLARVVKARILNERALMPLRDMGMPALDKSRPRTRLAPDWNSWQHGRAARQESVRSLTARDARAGRCKAQTGLRHLPLLLPPCFTFAPFSRPAKSGPAPQAAEPGGRIRLMPSKKGANSRGKNGRQHNFH
jgi:hypothetical protein